MPALGWNERAVSAKKIVAVLMICVCLTEGMRHRRRLSEYPPNRIAEMTLEPRLDTEPDRLCGLHPFDVLISSLLQNAPSNDSTNVMMLSSAVTSLYRTQPDFYGFLMRCTSAWNACQRRRMVAVVDEEAEQASNAQPWRLLCTTGLALQHRDTSAAK
ncbi:unnamed protein product [Mesocestoides corti]|uniref:Secreted protein n=1 Tax=Mesocestoides corti TaxID=53468 RepID=A0A0R3U7X0_MESCO|nr:unnamed protein product [Mesocestoides corti]